MHENLVLNRTISDKTSKILSPLILSLFVEQNIFFSKYIFWEGILPKELEIDFFQGDKYLLIMLSKNLKDLEI